MQKLKVVLVVAAAIIALATGVAYVFAYRKTVLAQVEKGVVAVKAGSMKLVAWLMTAK